MILERLIQKAEGHILNLGKRFWNEDPDAELDEEAGQLCTALRRNYASLQEKRAEVEELRSRLLTQEKRAGWLAGRVETYLHVGDQVNAWQHALELDQVRRGLHEERPRLRQLILVCREHETRVERLEHALADVQARLHQPPQALPARLRAQS